MIRSVIIDDEFLARERLKKLLEAHVDVQVVGEARNGKEGLSLIQVKSPTLIFLDIEMPDLDGFSVLSRLNRSPMVVFTTAYADYAVKAFEVKAADYLLKPFDEDRLGACLSGIRQQIKTRKSAELGIQMEQLVRSSTVDESKYRLSFILKEKGYETEIFAEEVMLMIADGNYVRLITPDKAFLYRISMNNLESELNPAHFIRIHRGIIVNRHAIQSHKYLGNNEFEFVMQNGQRVVSSRSYKSAIQQSMR